MKTFTRAGLLAASISVLALGGAWAAEGEAKAPVKEGPLAMELAPAKGGAKLTVTSAGFKNNAHMPEKYSQVGAPSPQHDITGPNKSPPLTWSGAPAGT